MYMINHWGSLWAVVTLELGRKWGIHGREWKVILEKVDSNWLSAFCAHLCVETAFWIGLCIHLFFLGLLPVNWLWSSMKDWLHWTVMQNDFLLCAFCKVLLKQSFTPEAVSRTVEETIQQVQFVREMYALGLGEVEVRAEIKKYQPQIIAFAQKHCAPMKTASVLSSWVAV